MREYGSEHPAIILPDGYFDKFSEFKRNFLFLRSGREALLLAAIVSSTQKEKTILFPAYCCWSMSAPFEKVGWKVVYYRLREDLTVDTDYLKVLLEQEKPQAVLTMNFYGSASTEDAICAVREYEYNNKGSIKIIEDFSHCTFSFRNIFNQDVDIYVSSIRKSIGISDGSIILSKEALPIQYIQEEQKDFADNRFAAQTKKALYTYSKNQNEKSEFLLMLRNCESIIDEFTAVRPISERARRQLALVNGEEIAYARRENMRHLWTLLDGNVDMVPGLERCMNGAPFSLPILVDKRDEVQSALAKRGVYTQLLWPICKEAQQVCKVSKMMNARMLSVPVDQRYSWDDIEDMARIICEIVNRTL